MTDHKLDSNSRVLVSWSSGKDAAWALHVVQTQTPATVVGLVTTVTAHFDRVSVHGVRREVLETQADACGLPLFVSEIPYPCPNEAYEAAMLDTLAVAAERTAATHLAFGDLFLQDVRLYRERMLEGTSLKPVFPIWGLVTEKLAREMVDAKLSAYVVCSNKPELSERVGGLFDDVLLDALPEGVDPCGENGEFHTCVVDGPMFKWPVNAAPTEIVDRESVRYSDIELL